MTMEVPSGGISTTGTLIQYRRDVADLERRIRNRRLQILGLWGTPLLLAFVAASGISLKIFIWLHSDMPSAVNGTLGGVIAFLALATIVQLFLEFIELWQDSGTSISSLRLELELAEEFRILEARRLTPPAMDQEIVRLRNESSHYRRLHLSMQWLLFFSSAAVSAVTAWFDPPQPGKGILIALGSVVTLVTAASGYFKPRERAFNLQQTADSMEQHLTALELGISPYNEIDDSTNLRAFATTVEGLRAEQRMREQQLDQPQQGQREVI